MGFTIKCDSYFLETHCFSSGLMRIVQNQVIYSKAKDLDLQEKKRRNFLNRSRVKDRWYFSVETVISKRPTDQDHHNYTFGNSGT